VHLTLRLQPSTLVQIESEIVLRVGVQQCLSWVAAALRLVRRERRAKWKRLTSIRGERVIRGPVTR